MRISRDKTEVMVTSREPIQCDIELDGETLRQVEQFKYLGNIFVREGGCKEDVKTRCLQAAQIFYQLSPILGTKKSAMDKIRNEEIWRRVNMQPAAQTANKNNIRWWSHIKRMAPTVPQSKALVILPKGRRPRGRPRNRWEDDVPRWYNEMGIPMTDVNNWVKERRPIVYPIDADGRRVRLK